MDLISNSALPACTILHKLLSFSKLKTPHHATWTMELIPSTLSVSMNHQELKSDHVCENSV